MLAWFIAACRGSPRLPRLRRAALSVANAYIRTITLTSPAQIENGAVHPHWNDTSTCHPRLPIGRSDAAAPFADLPWLGQVRVIATFRAPSSSFASTRSNTAN